MKYIIMDGDKPSAHLLTDNKIGQYTDCQTGKSMVLKLSQLAWFDWLNAKETKYPAGYFVAWAKRLARKEVFAHVWAEAQFFEGDGEIYSLSPVTQAIKGERKILPEKWELF